MTPTRHYYNANGLNFASEIAFPEMRPADNIYDVTIRYGKVPEKLDNIAYQGVCTQISPGHYLLTIDGVARYLLKDGNEVTIEPFGHVNEDDVRVFFLSSVMGAICHQRGLLPLHASAIALKDSCILFAGNSATGKSTVAAAFYAKGYSLLSDDICSISLDRQGLPVVNPGYIQLKLWADSLKLLKNVPVEPRRLRNKIDKYSVIVNNDTGIHPLPINKIYVLTNNKTGEIKVSQIRGRAKLSPIMRNTFRFYLYRRIGAIPAHLSIVNKLFYNTRVNHVSRSYRPGGIEKLVNILEKDFSK